MQVYALSLSLSAALFAIMMKHSAWHLWHCCNLHLEYSNCSTGFDNVVFGKKVMLHSPRQALFSNTCFQRKIHTLAGWKLLNLTVWSRYKICFRSNDFKSPYSVQTTSKNGINRSKRNRSLGSVWGRIGNFQMVWCLWKFYHANSN